MLFVSPFINSSVSLSSLVIKLKKIWYIALVKSKTRINAEITYASNLLADMVINWENTYFRICRLLQNAKRLLFLFFSSSLQLSLLLWFWTIYASSNAIRWVFAVLFIVFCHLSSDASRIIQTNFNQIHKLIISIFW